MLTASGPVPAESMDVSFQLWEAGLWKHPWNWYLVNGEGGAWTEARWGGPGRGGTAPGAQEPLPAAPEPVLPPPVLLSGSEHSGLPTLSAGSRDAAPHCQPLPRAPRSWASSLSCSPGGRRPRLGQTCMTHSPNPRPPDQETEP